MPMEQGVAASTESSESGKYGGKGRGKKKHFSSKDTKPKNTPSGTNPAVVSVSVESKKNPASEVIADEKAQTAESIRVVSTPSAGEGVKTKKRVPSNKEIADQIERREYVLGAKPGDDQKDFELREKTLRQRKRPSAQMGTELGVPAIETITPSTAKPARVPEVSKDPDSGYFGAADYREVIDDAAWEKQQNDKRLKKIQEDFDADGDRIRTEREQSSKFNKDLDGVSEMASEAEKDSSKGDRDKVSVHEKSGEEEAEPEEERVLEGEYIPRGEETIPELRERVGQLKNDSDEARNRYFRLKHRDESKWRAVKSYFSSLRKAPPPEALVNEVEVLKNDWNYKLTLYKNARVTLAKREAADRSSGRKTGEVMAEAIRELDLRGAVENYNAWKDAAWSGKEDSWLLRSVGRAKDWGEWYRNLDWKKKVAISGMLIGVGVTGVVAGSVGMVGLGFAGSTVTRLLGSYSAARGVYEYTEGRENKNVVRFHEAALSNVEKGDNPEFLEQRTKNYADRMQKDFERMIRGNKRRVLASVGLGTLLFVGGTAFSLTHAVGAADSVVNRGASAVSVLEDPSSVEVPDGGLSAAEQSAAEVSQAEVSQVAAPLPSSGVGGFTSESALAGSGSREGAIRIAKEIGQTLVGTETVPKGSSVEGSLIRYLMEQGGVSDKEEAGRVAHRMVNSFVNTNKERISLHDLTVVQPGTELNIVSNADPDSVAVAKLPFKLESVKLAPVSGANAAAGVSFVDSPALPSEPTPVQPTVPLASVDKSTVATGMTRGWGDSEISPSGTDVTSDPPDILAGEIPTSAPPIENISRMTPAEDLGALSLSAPGSEYFTTVRTAMETQLDGYPLSERDRDLIESIFTIRVPVAGSEPTKSALLLTKEQLAKAILPPGSLERLSQEELTDEVKRKVNVAVYAALKRIGGEALNVKHMATRGITVDGWLEKMARYILTHPIESRK